MSLVKANPLVGCSFSPSSMHPMKIAFDISQTGTAKAGCGFYAAALIDELLKTANEHDFMLLTSFGDFFHDSAMASSSACRYRGVRYGPRLKRREDAEIFWGDSKQIATLFSDFDVLHANNFWCPPGWVQADEALRRLFKSDFA